MSRGSRQWSEDQLRNIYCLLHASLFMHSSVRALWHLGPFILFLNSRKTVARLKTNCPDGVVTQEHKINNLNFAKQRCSKHPSMWENVWPSKHLQIAASSPKLSGMYKHFHTQCTNMGAGCNSMACYETPLWSSSSRRARQRWIWLIRICKQSLLLTHRLPPLRHKEKFLCNFWKNRRGELAQGTEKQNNTISLVNAARSALRHPALWLQDVDVTAEPDIMLELLLHTVWLRLSWSNNEDAGIETSWIWAVLILWMEFNECFFQRPGSSFSSLADSQKQNQMEIPSVPTRCGSLRRRSDCDWNNQPVLCKKWKERKRNGC